MKNRNNILLSILGIITLVIVTVGVSYAFFSYTKKGTTENSIKTGTITFMYTEVTGVGKGIKIEDSLPISDDQGKLLTGSGNVFEFKITSDTLSNTSIPYEVTARKSSNSTLDEKAVKVYLTEVDGEESELLLDNYSNLKETDTTIPEGIVEKTLYKGKVPANTTKYEKNFKLRMWLDEGIDFSPVKDEDGNDTYPYNGKSFTLTVNVYANANVVTESDKAQEANANIKSVGINNSELTKVENKEYQYEATLPEGTTEAAIDIETENEYSTVKVEKIDSLVYNETRSNIKRLSTKKTVELNPGDNYFKVTVTSEDKTTTKEYKIKISVKSNVSIFGYEYDVVNAEPTLTTSINNTSDESGLYKSTDTNTGEPTYYFRGNVKNNYVSFAGQKWRIVRINEDGTVRIVMQNGINGGYNYPYSTGVSMYYTTSKAKTILDEWYQTNIESNTDYSKFVVTGNYYCEQAKVRIDSTYTFDKAEVADYQYYLPNFRCETDGNGYGLVNSSVGLLTYDEVVYAGGYYKQSNNLYYLPNSSYSYVLMSPGGINIKNNKSQSNTWQLYRSGAIYSDPTGYSYALRPVINLKADTKASGTGTASDPYVIQ